MWKTYLLEKCVALGKNAQCMCDYAKTVFVWGREEDVGEVV